MQVIVAAICTWIALVVCETEEKPQKETTPDAKETPAEKDEIPAKNADVPAADDTDEECSESCEREYSACLNLIKISSMKVFFSTRCKYLEYDCKGSCSRPMP